MSMFDEMLKEGESLFRDTVPLDFDYQPKVLLYREQEQKQFALAIKPLLHERNGRNLFVYGPPGIGKTVACKHVLRELEETTDDVVPLYINCWKHNSSYKILSEICQQLGHKILVNKKTSELFTIAKEKLNKTSTVLVLDEIDKVEDFDFLYMFLEEIYRKSIFLITNFKDKVKELDKRIVSRLNPEFIEFEPYNAKEIKGILKERRKYAFVPKVWQKEAFNLVVKKTNEIKDIRTGLYLMKEAGNCAEDKASKKITKEHVKEAIKKADEFSIKRKEELDEELQNILKLVKNNSGSKIGDLHKKFTEKHRKLSLKQFKRKIKKLAKNKFISTKKSTTKEGNTTLVNYTSEKKLTEY